MGTSIYHRSNCRIHSCGNAHIKKYHVGGRSEGPLNDMLYPWVGCDEGLVEIESLSCGGGGYYVQRGPLRAQMQIQEGYKGPSPKQILASVSGDRARMKSQSVFQELMAKRSTNLSMSEG